MRRLRQRYDLLASVVALQYANEGFWKVLEADPDGFLVFERAGSALSCAPRRQRASWVAEARNGSPENTEMTSWRAKLGRGGSVKIVGIISLNRITIEPE